MMEQQGTDPKRIVAVQMLCIGIVLFILGVVVFLSSPLRTMTPLFRTWSLLSDGAIILAGIAFTAGGVVRIRHLKK